MSASDELVHGGRLLQVAMGSSIPLKDWLDLSTGISPFSYPVESIPHECFQQLPQQDAELNNIAADYYGAAQVIASAGSQPVIQLLPKLWLDSFDQPTRVWLPKVGYKEHQFAWQKAGFRVQHYQSLPDPTELQALDILVVINPNNPTGQLDSIARLQLLKNEIERLGGWLICDEAFLDCYQEHKSLSMCQFTGSEHLFVMRSVGKFFGLAGIRLGFVAASPTWLDKLSTALGPWSVNGPAQWLGKKCLADQQWQTNQRIRLQQLSNQLQQLLSNHFERIQGTALFQTAYTGYAAHYYQQLLAQGVYVRLTDEGDSLRFGLPKQTKGTWQKLEAALKSLTQ